MADFFKAEMYFEMNCFKSAVTNFFVALMKKASICRNL